jgi:hypothetical protein
MRKPLTMENYLEGRAISDPIHLFDCVMPCAKAEAFLVCREEHARAVNPPFARMQSAIERHNAYQDDPIQYRGGWAVDRDDLCRASLLLILSNRRKSRQNGYGTVRTVAM